MTTHELKLDIRYFDDVKSGKKNFEIRKDDRDFKVGDILELRKISWLEKFLVPIRFAIDVMTCKRQTYIDINGNPCVKSKADTIKVRIKWMSKHLDNYNKLLEDAGLSFSIESVGLTLAIESVINEYFHTNVLPDGYVVLGIEVTE